MSKMVATFVIFLLCSAFQPIHSLHVSKHLQVAHSLCSVTPYPDLCISTLSSLDLTELDTADPAQAVAATTEQAIGSVQGSEETIFTFQQNPSINEPAVRNALQDCSEVQKSTVSGLNSTRQQLLSSTTAAGPDLQEVATQLSSSMTNQDTCGDGFSYNHGNVSDAIVGGLNNVSKHISNGLALLKNVPAGNQSAAAEELKVEGGFPSWMTGNDRRLLQTPAKKTKYHLVVAKDGSGDFTTISQAVAAAPDYSHTRFVIYIKAGVYLENVEIGETKTKLMFAGDGIGKTVVKASRSRVDGWTTYRSATVAVVGKEFIARGITFENSSPQRKRQAVALRCNADFSAFYKCSFVSNRNTLYAHSFRQFYRDCDIYGTVDSIFGNAAAVFQNCNLYARKPFDGQKNTFTAQARGDPNQNTGFSFLNCKIAAASDLAPVKHRYKTYLGRPWGKFSRTVVINSYIDDVVDPAGWLEWKGMFGLRTLYYGEYMNSGPGSNTMGRVKWAGFRVINSTAEATQFTVESLIQGGKWLKSTTVPYHLGL